MESELLDRKDKNLHFNYPQILLKHTYAWDTQLIKFWFRINKNWWLLPSTDLRICQNAQTIGNSSQFNFVVNSSLTELGELPSSVPNDKIWNVQHFQNKPTIPRFYSQSGPVSLLEKITLKEEKLKNTFLDQSQWADASREGQKGEGGGSTSENFIHQKKKKKKKKLVKL